MLRRAGRLAADAVLTVSAWCAAPVQAARDAYQIYHPLRAEGGRTPADKGLPMRPLTIVTSRDGLRLDAWAVPGEGPHTVVVCHGMGRTKSSVLDHVRMLHAAGYHVVAYDLRNHGASGRDRRYTRMADRFTSDLRDVLRHVRDDPELGGGRLAVLAFSFSTWPAVYVLRDPSVRVAAVICDSGPLYDIPAGFRHYSELRRAALPAWLSRPGAFRLYRAAFQRLSDHMLAVQGWPPALDGVPTRLMFIAGACDPVVSPDQVRAVASRYPDAEYWAAPNGMHMSALRLDREEYRRRVTEFLAEAFAASDQTGMEYRRA